MTDLAWTFGEELEERIERLEPALYLGAFALALALRWLNLGAAPLGDAEASWAMQALQIARPGAEGAAQIGANPGYIVPTGVSFWLLGATDFLARAWPALSGALLAGGAFLFRRDLGRIAAAILAFGLALDPGLATVSRQAGGPMPALAFTLLAIGMWRNGRPRWAGIFTGLALLSGPSIFPSLAALALAAWAAKSVQKRLTLRYSSGEPAPAWDAPQPQGAHVTQDANRMQALVAGGVTLALVGTALLRVPQGAPALFGALAAYFQGWSGPAGAGAPALLLALAAFELLPLIFALLHIGRTVFFSNDWEDEEIILSVFASVWALTALALALIYPARQTSDLVWAIVPLWLLAGRELAHYLPERRPHIMAWMQALMLVTLAILFWITLTTTPVLVQENVPWETLRLVILAGILALAVLTSALVALGWNWPISRDGSAWGGLLALLVYSTSMLWGASQLRPNQPQELWGQTPGPAQTRLLTETVRQLSLWGRGMTGEIEIISNVDAASLRWALHDYQNARFGSLPAGNLSGDIRPAIVITSDLEQSPELAAEYRGQDFAWWARPGWEGALPENLKDWLTYRRAPVTYDHIILWARSDLFPGASANP